MDNNYAYNRLYGMILDAYFKARKSKRSHNDAHKFELNLFENTHILTRSILARTYHPTNGIAFVNFKPVIREVIAAEFKDRVVQHVAFKPVYEWWDKRLHPNSCSCRIGKGTDYAISKLYSYMQSVSDNWTTETYVCKFDYKAYFMCINQKILYERIIWGLSKQFNKNSWDYKLQQFLWETIIFDNVTTHVHKKGAKSEWDLLPKSRSLFFQPQGVGLPIGNVTSQMASNIILDAMDRFISIELGYNKYVRYVDDWVVVVDRKGKEKLLKEDLPRIEERAASLGLTLHPQKRYIQEINRGVPFLGARLYPYHILPDYRLIKNFRAAAEKFNHSEGDLASLQSYLGRMMRYKAAKLECDVFENLGWDYPWT